MTAPGMSAASSDAALPSVSRSLSISPSRAPSRANSLAAAHPMPRAAPVMIAAFPESRPVMGSERIHQSVLRNTDPAVLGDRLKKSLAHETAHVHHVDVGSHEMLLPPRRYHLALRLGGKGVLGGHFHQPRQGDVLKH